MAARPRCPGLLETAMDVVARPTRYQQVSAVAENVLSLGESGRCEFKRDAEAVSPESWRRWRTGSRSIPLARSHLLVGVDEVEDKALDDPNSLTNQFSAILKS